MKVIFLDIDGVLNYAGTTQRWRGFIGIDPEKVKMFNEIIDKTQAKVVLSSTWRLDDDWLNTMVANGLRREDFVGRTIRLTKTRYELPEHPGWVPRGAEIQEWLDKNPEVERYVIIDDDSDMLSGQILFQTSWNDRGEGGGLTQALADEIVKYLNGDDNARPQ